jgi:Ulp1 family protease
VTKWTMKKGIDIFTKKLIYFPINKNLHWSLCVIVNPGHIEKYIDGKANYDPNAPYPCILFFDSLKIHARNVVKKNVIKWLNSEWVRLKKSSTLESPFDGQTLTAHSPKGTLLVFRYVISEN